MHEVRKSFCFSSFAIFFVIHAALKSKLKENVFKWHILLIPISAEGQILSDIVQ